MIVFSHFIQIMQIPFFCVLFLVNEGLINMLDVDIVPSQELVLLIFSSILLTNVSSIVDFLDKTNFNYFSKRFNHWLYVTSLILSRVMLTCLLSFFGYLIAQMIIMEFKFGTIFVAKFDWEYSWVFKIPLLFWTFLIGFYSMISLKSLLLPFSLNSNK